LSSETRHNLFLATKEALNNVLKHAQATEVWLRLTVQPRGFTVIVQDNGRGFKPGEMAAPMPAGGRIVSGYGLKNMVKRLESISGLCEIISAPGNGTSVKLTVSLESNQSPILASSQKGGDERE
jgi:signal transduction histidine kinase